jgi:hypothetical protein
MHIEKDIHTNPARQVEVQDQLRRDYGVEATGSVVGQDYHAERAGAPLLDWTDPQLKRVTRLRLLGDPGLPFLDISYAYGETKDGKPCRVQFPFSQLPYSRNGKAMWAVMYSEGTKAGVYVNRLFAGCDISTLR